ncbi:histidine kinase [Halobacillus sp. A1]|uniref:sensor histidine kinase n=1 Tax=Halobacillus sp. A1 TaxID=2880262 RepID=UPI0020A66E18|nr:histidine kinase [Halobacillus sp. A1]MCP3030213.1 histidine kinase [Halobacillus sp. A1]
MTYQQIKWLIVVVPALAIGLWEYIRHEWLLSIISMELGNWLTPLFVLAFSILINSKLFQILEKNQRELEQEKMKQAIINERQEISRELHDSISQSLFLLSVKIQQLHHSDQKKIVEIESTIDKIQSNVRHSIKHLRTPDLQDWNIALHDLLDPMRRQRPDIKFHMNWPFQNQNYTMDEKVHFFWIIREGLINVLKHGDQVSNVTIIGTPNKIELIDDGTDLIAEDAQPHYGLEMMKDRAKSINWKLCLVRERNQTVLRLEKGENAS